MFRTLPNALPRYALLLGLLLTASWHSIAEASCSWAGGMPGPSRYAGTANPITVDVTYRRVGDRLSDIGGMGGNPSWKTNCSGQESAGYYNSVGPQQPALTNSEKGALFAMTAIPGIGYSLSDTNLYQGPQHSYFSAYGSIRAPQGEFYFDAGNKVRVDFWKIGDTQAGSYCLPAGSQLGYVQFDGLRVFEARLSNQLCIHIQQPTCAVSTASKNITVDLGSYQQSRFTQGGQTTNSKPFNISLNNCSRVEAIDIQFNANPDPDVSNAALNGVVQLDHGGSLSATGVAVQILDNRGNPQKLNQAQSVWQQANGNVDLPFAVRYIQTRQQVTAGNANASIQFVMSYR